MLTAMQSARHRAAEGLLQARGNIAGTTALICWGSEDARQLSQLISSIDQFLARLIPNEPAGPGVA